ncbi:tyrosine-type recombinase/integrase [Streptomyces sp. NBC_01242]|uniref:tyrosine-type recombinase/integrase n=1 Tax=Streptomyces sp. NBC_01242 TaxID=2903795 RepID=UPI002B1D3588|nr:tyrosine-type recombinase/integrase [Streptomyces sp. NBC_01242]
MEQIESEQNLALLDPETRALVLICRDEGLRISEALTLKTDCLKKTSSGRWALVHYKSKDKSFRAIPASRVVVDAIREQHGRVRERFDGACQWLFPKVSGNPDGKYPMPYGTVDTRFDAWLKRIRLIDSNGDAAAVSWHQFRHTLGTRMANAGVSGRTIREVLGHTSWQMQEHYSRIADDTLRREYEEKYEVRFNRKGEAVKIHRDCDLSGPQPSGPRTRTASEPPWTDSSVERFRPAESATSRPSPAKRASTAPRSTAPVPTLTSAPSSSDASKPCSSPATSLTLVRPRSPVSRRRTPSSGNG